MIQNKLIISCEEGDRVIDDYKKVWRLTDQLFYLRKKNNEQVPSMKNRFKQVGTYVGYFHIKDF